MEITVMSRQMIKPSSPTPHHLQHLKLSLIDQYMTPHTIGAHLILFYSAQGDVHQFQTTNMSDRLKKSLSEVLTEFYPVAGSFNNNNPSVIHCNDFGLEYTEARVKAPHTLSQVLNSPQAGELRRLLPNDAEPFGADFNGLSAVRVTIFDGCGGMAIGVHLAHLVADGLSLATFVNSWAAIARRDASLVANNKILSPEFGCASLFPPRDIGVRRLVFDKDAGGRPQPNLVTKRFVFNQMKIDALRADLAYESPTKVEAVLALVLKCLINVSKSTGSKSTVLIMAINLRSRMSPSLPMHYFGNIALPWKVERIDQESDSLNDLGEQIRNSIREINSDYLGKLLVDNSLLLSEIFEQPKKLFTNGVRLFGFTSWCRFPVYEVDVGWGVPTWATSFYHRKDAIKFIDAKNGDGIEAWVSLSEDDMRLFESEEQLLQFSCPNPMVSEP